MDYPIDVNPPALIRPHISDATDQTPDPKTIRIAYANSQEFNNKSGHKLDGVSTRDKEPAMSENLELMGNIARVLVNHQKLTGIEWVEISVVFSFDNEGDVHSTYGYAYDTLGNWTAISFKPREVRPQVNAYREWLRQEGDKGFIKMLFQFNKVTRQVKADFEYDDPSRWQVTPKNIDTIIEELRPNLGK